MTRTNDATAPGSPAAPGPSEGGDPAPSPAKQPRLELEQQRQEQKRQQREQQKQQQRLVAELWRSCRESEGYTHLAARSHFADLSKHKPRATFALLPLRFADGLQRARFRAEERFFNPHRGRAGRMAKRRARQRESLGQLAHHRYHSFRWDEPKTINLDGRSARWLVTMERLYAERLMNLRGWKAKLGAWIPGQKSNIPAEEVPGWVKEHYRLGTTKICCRMGGKKLQLRLRCCRVEFGEEGTAGDWRTESYDKIFQCLKTCVADDQGPTLARILIDAAHGVHLAAATFNDKYGLGLDADVVEYALDLFRRLFFMLLVKEPGGFQSTVYLYGWADKYKAGLAVSLARALLLLRDGHIRMADVFKTSADYNPFTVQNMISRRRWEEVLDACSRIDELYKQHFRIRSLDTEQAHRDLLAVFGGDSSDSDGGEYSDDERKATDPGPGDTDYEDTDDDDDSDVDEDYNPPQSDTTVTPASSQDVASESDTTVTPASSQDVASESDTTVTPASSQDVASDCTADGGGTRGNDTDISDDDVVTVVDDSPDESDMPLKQRAAKRKLRKRGVQRIRSSSEEDAAVDDDTGYKSDESSSDVVEVVPKKQRRSSVKQRKALKRGVQRIRSSSEEGANGDDNADNKSDESSSDVVEIVPKQRRQRKRPIVVVDLVDSSDDSETNEAPSCVKAVSARRKAAAERKARKEREAARDREMLRTLGASARTR